MADFEDNLKRVTVVTGGFGSGKSEFSINLALRLANRKSGSYTQEVALADLDIINAYFRSREACDLMTAHGIKAVVPPQEIFHSDLPIYGPGIPHLLRRRQDVRLIIDVGGDDLGATALSGLAGEIQASEHCVVMIVNTYRPYTRDVPGICRMCKDIEHKSRMQVDALISNPNLGPSTTPEAVMKGHHLVETAAAKLGRPVLALTVLRKFLELWKDKLVVPERVPIFPIDIYLSPEWLQRPYSG